LIRWNRAPLGLPFFPPLPLPFGLLRLELGVTEPEAEVEGPFDWLMLDDASRELSVLAVVTALPSSLTLRFLVVVVCACTEGCFGFFLGAFLESEEGDEESDEESESLSELLLLLPPFELGGTVATGFFFSVESTSIFTVSVLSSSDSEEESESDESEESELTDFLVAATELVVTVYFSFFSLTVEAEESESEPESESEDDDDEVLSSESTEPSYFSLAEDSVLLVSDFVGEGEGFDFVGASGSESLDSSSAGLQVSNEIKDGWGN
jgi:hypothetical protein